jgi:HK97 family phage portal protein
VPLFRRRRHAEAVQERQAAPATQAALPTQTWQEATRRPSIASTAGEYVDERATLGIAAAWASVHRIASTIATLPLHTYDGTGRIDDPPIIDRPVPTEDRVDTISAVVVSLLLHGNYFAPLVGLDELGYPTSMYPVHPTSVLLRPRAGRWTFEVPGLGALEASELLWVKGITLPGRPLGLGVIEAQAETLGHARALGRWARGYFTDDATPPGIIQMDGEMTPEEAKEIREEWIASHAGSRAPAVLTNGAKFSEFGMSAEALQFIQSRQLSAAEVAALFGVPPSMIGAPSGDSLTYATVEGNALTFVRYGLQQWIVRLERAFSALLPPGQFVKFQLGGLLRGTTSERYTAYQTAIGAGFMTIDEVRALEDLPPLEVAPAADNAVPAAPPAPRRLRVVRDNAGQVIAIVEEVPNAA